VLLREYQPSDLEKMCEADRLCFDPRVAYSRGEMSAFLSASGALAIVAEISRHGIAGFVIAHRRGERAHIITLDVLPRWRRLGLGRRLMRSCEAKLRNAGVSTIRLETAAGNTAAQSLYRGLGYTCVRRLRGYYVTGEDAWLMEKNLDKRPFKAAARRERARGCAGN